MNCHPVFGCSGHNHTGNDLELTNLLIKNITLEYIGESILPLQNRLDELDSDIENILDGLDTELGGRLDDLGNELGDRIDAIDIELGKIPLVDGKIPDTKVSTADGSTQNLKNAEYSLELSKQKLDTGITATAKNGGVPRTQAEKNSDVLHVKDFGALGNTSDDYLALQKALDHLDSIGGGVLHFDNSGTYCVSAQLRVYEGTQLLLNGCTIRRCFDTSPTGSSLIGITGKRNVQIKNGVLDGNGTTYYSGHNILGGLGGADDFLFEDLTFLDVVNAHAIDFNNVTRMWVNRCKFLGYSNVNDPEVGDRYFSEAIQIDPSYVNPPNINTNIIITNCYCGKNPDNTDSRFTAFPAFVGNHSSNVATTIDNNIIIANNTIEDAPYAGVKVLAWDNVKVINNTFLNCKVGINIAGGTGTKLQGSTLLTISGNVFINPTTTIADGNWGIQMNTVSNQYKHQDVLIEANTFVGGLYGMQLHNSKNLCISNNTYKSCRTAIYSVPNIVLDSLVLCGNRFVDSAVGVYIRSALMDSSITANHFYGTTGRPIHLSGTDDVENRKGISICNNKFYGGSPSIVQLDSGASSNVNISDNYFAPDRNNLSNVPTTLIRSTITGGGITILNNVAHTEWVSIPHLAGSGAILRGFYGANPDSVVTAGVGSVLDVVIATDYTRYVKKTASDATGWVAQI